MKKRLLVLAFASLLIWSGANAQIPIELFAGHQKTTLDIMFFKYFKRKSGENAPLLFFNRNRASLDYAQTTTSHLPQFGFTEALSFNLRQLKGFAPVVVAQVSNGGIYPKGGVQYFHRSKDFTLFTWVVCEFMKDPRLDWFVLMRWEPKLAGSWHLFTQLELFSVLPTAKLGNLSFFQRARVGLRLREWQFGLGADFSEVGKTNFVQTQNVGVFLRHEF